MKSSTEAIERRTEVLNRLSSHRKQLESTQAALHARRARHVHHANQKKTAEVQYIKLANDQLLESVAADLRAELGRITKDVKSVPAIVSEVLNSDDRAFEELNELSSSASSKQEDSLELNALEGRVNQLIEALRLLRADALKDRFDRTYLEALCTSNDSLNGQDVSDTSTEAIQSDLGSLYAEIEDVVTMVVANEHGNVVHTALHNARQAHQQQRRMVNEKVCQTATPSLIHRPLADSFAQVYNKLGSQTAVLENLTEISRTLQSHRLGLRDLENQVEHLKANDRAPPKPPNLPAPSKVKDGLPAAAAFIQHLGLITDGDSKSREDVDITNQLNILTLKLEQQSTHDIAQVLQLSERAAIKRLAAMQDVSDALGPDASHETAVRQLEERIAAAKSEMERSTG